MEDLDSEIARLNQKKVELTNKLNAARDYDERENLGEEIKRIQAQIEVLEKFKRPKN